MSRTSEKCENPAPEEVNSTSRPLDRLPDGLAMTVGGFAELVGTSTHTIRDRLARRLLSQSGRNRLLVAENVRLYCDELRHAAGRHGAGHRAPGKERLVEAQAQTAELKLAKLKGDLLDAREVEREWSDALRRVRAGVLAAPSRIGARLGLSAADVEAVAAELRDALEMLADDPGAASTLAEMTDEELEEAARGMI